MTAFSRHGEWLSLIDVSGPFLAEPVLKQIFPQGLEQTDHLTRKHVRQAYDEWREAVDTDDPDCTAIHRAWIDLVLKRVLELDEDGEEDVLKPGSALPESLAFAVSQHDVTLRPDYAVFDADNGDRPLMFAAVYPPDVDLGAPVKGERWAAPPAERMVELCRACDVRLGLVTNGECWMLVDAPVGGVTSFASWYARLWGQEPVTLQAFVNLLGIRRFFADDAERLPALLDESLKTAGRSHRRPRGAGTARGRSPRTGARPRRCRPQPRTAGGSRTPGTLRSGPDRHDADRLPSVGGRTWPVVARRRKLPSLLCRFDAAYAAPGRFRGDSRTPAGRMVAAAGDLPCRLRWHRARGR